MQEINLYDLLRYYWKHWILIVTITVIGLISGLIYNSFIQEPLYKSSSTLILVTNNQTVTAYDTTRINNYITLLKSRSVLEPVISNLKLNETYESLSSSLSASNITNTEVIRLSITGKNAKESSSIANNAVASFRKEVKSIYNLDNVKVVDNASSPSTPYNVNKSLQLALFTLAGFLASVITVFFKFNFNLNKKKNKLSTTSRKKLAPIKYVKSHSKTLFIALFARTESLFDRIKAGLVKYDLIKVATPPKKPVRKTTPFKKVSPRVSTKNSKSLKKK